MTINYAIDSVLHVTIFSLKFVGMAFAEVLFVVFSYDLAAASKISSQVINQFSIIVWVKITTFIK